MSLIAVLPLAIEREGGELQLWEQASSESRRSVRPHHVTSPTSASSSVPQDPKGLLPGLLQWLVNETLVPNKC